MAGDGGRWYCDLLCYKDTLWMPCEVLAMKLVCSLGVLVIKKYIKNLAQRLDIADRAHDLKEILYYK